MKPAIRSMVVAAVCLAAVVALTPARGERLSARSSRQAQGAGITCLSELERSIFRLTNDVRRKHGLPSLVWESSLAEVARAHSADMLAKGYFSHVNQEGKSPHDRIAAGYRFGLAMSGENIWGGTGHDPRETRLLARIIVDSWMSSPGHRKNLLGPDYTDIGIGVAARGKDIRATQVLVRTQK